MKLVDLPIDELQEAPWNSNHMDDYMLERLRSSIEEYGLVEPVVVRSLRSHYFEVLSGNQRLKVLRELKFKSIPCFVVD